MQPTVVMTARGAERWRRGHPWIYRADVAEVRAAAGDIVRVLGPRGRPAGWAFLSDRSQIALRMLSRSEAPFDRAAIRRRLEAALAFRDALLIDATACRLVHGEADLLPSLVVDRYGEYLVVQTLSQGMDRLLPDVVSMLAELASPAGILARNDARVRELEGLDRRVEPVHGEVPATVVVRDGAVELEVDLWKGQKTGLFLDQRENRQAAAAYARGRLLDCFTYNGGFALALARRCAAATAVDSSEDAVARTRQNALRNHLAGLEVVCANVFDFLRERERDNARYDTIVLDPPAFAKNKAAAPRAIAGYKEINLRALKLLEPGGHLVTCSCSYNVSEAAFEDVLHAAATDAGVPVTIVEKRMQARDHPVLLGVPETYYLKCYILRRPA
jgi:23S rRNA (cytosine1962-C5)-methyltransferase